MLISTTRKQHVYFKVHYGYFYHFKSSFGWHRMTTIPLCSFKMNKNVKENKMSIFSSVFMHKSKKNITLRNLSIIRYLQVPLSPIKMGNTNISPHRNTRKVTKPSMTNFLRTERLKMDNEQFGLGTERFGPRWERTVWPGFQILLFDSFRTFTYIAIVLKEKEIRGLKFCQRIYLKISFVTFLLVSH